MPFLGRDIYLNINQVDAMRGPQVVAGVELEEDEEGEEKTRDPSYVGVHLGEGGRTQGSKVVHVHNAKFDNDQKVPCGGGERVVESVAVDVDGEDDAADDVDQVEDGQVLGKGIVDCRGTGRGCIESEKKLILMTKLNGNEETC